MYRAKYPTKRALSANICSFCYILAAKSATLGVPDIPAE